jgi:predicted Zn-dependent protease
MTATAVAFIQAGNIDEAVPLLEAALRAEPANLSALNARAVTHASAGQFAKALDLLERSRAANPDHPLTWINLGATYEAQGQPDRAKAAYREAVRHQPDSSEARRRLNSLQ